jgi:CobQ-like glutamine amidotransferase family enzyme
MTATSGTALRIALVYPELLGTYGDGGNAEVLAGRLRWRGLPAEVVRVPVGAPVPATCDVYLLGGGEDEPQVLAAAQLREGAALRSAVEGGAVCLAVCAGLQILGESFRGADGEVHDGLGLLPLQTRRQLEEGPVPPRAVGDIAVDVDPAAVDGVAVPVLLGYENHGGRSQALPAAVGRPLGTVRPGVGIGNGTPDRAEGWVAPAGEGRVLATYLHGPVLALNPALADLLLVWAGVDLPPLERTDPAAALRRARLRALGLPDPEAVRGRVTAQG